MKESYWIIIWVVVVGAVFAYMWKSGQLARLSTYVQQTREELRKCTWPTVEELKGSTIIVFVSILLLGGFTVAVDAVFAWLITRLT